MVSKDYREFESDAKIDWFAAFHDPMMRSPKFDPKKSRVQLSRLEDKKSSLESNSFQTDSPNPVSLSGLEYSDTNSNSDERVSEVPEMMDNKSNKNEVESMSFNLELVQSVRSITVKSE